MPKAVTKNFPETIFVKREVDGETAYFAADPDVEILIAVGEKTKLARYVLAEVVEASGVVKLGS